MGNDWTKYKRARNKLNGIIKREKKTFYKNKLSGCKDSKEFWTGV